MEGIIIEKNDRGAQNMSTACVKIFAGCCKRKRELRRRRHGECLPGNSENIRFTVAVSGELSRIRMSRRAYAIGMGVRIDW